MPVPRSDTLTIPLPPAADTAQPAAPLPALDDSGGLQQIGSEMPAETVTQPGGPRERTIVYEAPFDRCDREQDYKTAWSDFEQRFDAVERELGQDANFLMVSLGTGRPPEQVPT